MALGVITVRYYDDAVRNIKWDCSVHKRVICFIVKYVISVGGLPILFSFMHTFNIQQNINFTHRNTLNFEVKKG